MGRGGVLITKNIKYMGGEGRGAARMRKIQGSLNY
jgi:hypothetical protein